ncbi:hypothetical protein BZA05DRAFT_60501 [Tricharina praecox]|uniref:uncharacterized protein n=1 Tax=Tricharina praecox TaxID=43433 RepID=UPI0022203E81|nr:uncharacterized protein BZA05DRAFT_60501 [Tricharina praecox]KAI5850666.1 hypothetical protein BZA05DRAFT_60501 [Tricharina praecox]
MVTPTRPSNSRIMSTRSVVEPLDSPPLSASSLSTPSISDDHDPLQHNSDAGGKDDGILDDDERRGRSATVEAARFEMDPRNMSPRRDSEELHQLGAETKARLEAQAQSLQSGLLALLERVDKVREEHDKLEGENRFLQEYIGSLMATSKITGSARNSGGRLK